MTPRLSTIIPLPLIPLMPVRDVQRILTSAARVSILICSCDLVGTVITGGAGAGETCPAKGPRVGSASTRPFVETGFASACGNSVVVVATGCWGTGAGAGT